VVVTSATACCTLASSLKAGSTIETVKGGLAGSMKRMIIETAGASADAQI